MSTSKRFEEIAQKLNAVNADPRIIDVMTKMVQDEKEFDRRQNNIHQERDRLKAELASMLNK